MSWSCVLKNGSNVKILCYLHFITKIKLSTYTFSGSLFKEILFVNLQMVTLDKQPFSVLNLFLIK